MTGYLQGISRNPPQEWADITLCQHLNAILGTTTITPWTLGEVPEHWIELIVKGTNLYHRMREQGLIKG